MPGARPSGFKKGGGFLDGVDSRITGYRWTDEFMGKAFEPGKIPSFDGKGKVEKPHNLNFELSVRVDGADEDTIVPLKADKEFEAWEVSEDGLVITPVGADEGVERDLPQQTAFWKFLQSLVKPISGARDDKGNPTDGFPETRLSETELRFEPIIGTRIRTVQFVDAERTKKFGQRADKKDKSKKYDRKDLMVDLVYELPDEEGTEAPAPAPTKATKAAPKATAKPAPAGKAGAKPAAKPAPVEAVDVPTLAAVTLVNILRESKDNTFPKNKLSMKALTVLAKNTKREDVRKLYFDDAFLGSTPEVVIDGTTYTFGYDQASGVLTLVTA